MTAVRPMAAPPGDALLETILRPLHDAWIADAHRSLEPALTPDADFWARWGAVRYLSDVFREQFRQERALVHELRALLSPEVSERLERSGGLIVRSRLELDRIGRRRGTSAEVAAATSQLLTQLGAWCAEIEQAVVGLRRTALGAEGAAQLARLAAAVPA